MLPRPPTSTLFPTRRSSDLREVGARRQALQRGRHRHDARVERTAGELPQRGEALGDEVRVRRELVVGRSEEHTSELQSQSNLVCRLLLEKKKNKNITIPCTA